MAWVGHVQAAPWWCEYTGVGDLGARGRKAKPESLSHEGNLNPVALRSLFEINHLSYLLNGFLGICGLHGSLSEASAGLTLSWEAGPASAGPSCIVWETSLPDEGQKHSKEVGIRK